MRRGRRRLTLRGLVVGTAPRLIRRGTLLFLVVRKDRVFPDFDRLNLAVVDYVDRLDGRVSVRLARRWRGGATADTSASTLPF